MPSSALGPHVVGSRIVVRRLLPGLTGPTGSAAFTDVLGVCTSWADGLCVVQPAEGDPVEVPVDLIVSGKPVPPRPSVRLRVSAREAESHAGPIWPTVERIALGEWELRTDSGPVGRSDGAGRRLIKRANSCLALGDPGMPLADAAEAVTAFYRDRDRPVLVQTELGGATETALRQAGWTPLEGADTHFMLVSLARASRLAAVRRHAATPVVAVDGPRCVVTFDLDHPGGAARGEAAVDGDWLGIHQIEVSLAHRRQGLAWALMAELLGWGAEQGATTAWLHVETGNVGALDLYERLGFMEHHSLRYIFPPHSGA